MSSQDNNSWRSNSCDPHWELIYHDKWHPWTSEITAPPEIAAGTHFQRKHGFITTLVFLPVDGEASWSLLPSSISVLSGYTVKPENTYYSSILKVTGQVCGSQKRISINTNHSYQRVHLSKPVSTDLTIKSDSVSTNPIGKDGVCGCSVPKHLPHKVYLLWHHH